MTDSPSPERIVEIEVALLRSLCSESISADAWQRASRALADYEWREPDHAVVYEALARVRQRGGRHWRDELAAQSTRMGFPDLDWTIYSNAETEPLTNLEDLIRLLKVLPDQQP